ncbi:MAG: preprotein translocase subunit YajC [Myxococcales bacterium FL481]|nr:MAG: preprotein translocase subunit YajC [Myxococcales bacterium FL481]
MPGSLVPPPPVTLLAEAAPGLMDSGLLSMLAIFAVVYFFLLRPMTRQEKDRKKRLVDLKKGDKVVIGGGILGRVSNLDEAVAVVEIADKVKVRVLKKDIVDLQEHALKTDDKAAKKASSSSAESADGASAKTKDKS